MPECLDNFPWRSLKGCGEMASAMFKVGDFKNAQLKDGTNVQFRIIGFKHDRTAGGIILPMTWEMVDCLPNRYRWNERDTTEGSWGGSWLCKQMNDERGSIYQLMPDDIIDVAVPVIKETGNTYNDANTIVESENKFWIKSEKELIGRAMYSVQGEGHWYEFYRQEDTPWGKKRNNSEEYTWLRSPYSGNGYYVRSVNTTGAIDNVNAYSSFGVAPAFAF